MHIEGRLGPPTPSAEPFNSANPTSPTSKPNPALLPAESALTNSGPAAKLSLAYHKHHAHKPYG
jgi:hypothetical protein